MRFYMSFLDTRTIILRQLFDITDCHSDVNDCHSDESLVNSSDSVRVY